LIETAILIGTEDSWWRRFFGLNLLYHLAVLQLSFGSLFPTFLPSFFSSLRERYNISFLINILDQTSPSGKVFSLTFEGGVAVNVSVENKAAFTHENVSIPACG
jgi:hypothetical protein